ncbi:hypothetical protein FRC16_004313, partial [Serendipita sp. 398]
SDSLLEEDPERHKGTLHAEIEMGHSRMPARQKTKVWKPSRGLGGRRGFLRVNNVETIAPKKIDAWWNEDETESREGQFKGEEIVEVVMKSQIGVEEDSSVRVGSTYCMSAS